MASAVEMGALSEPIRRAHSFTNSSKAVLEIQWGGSLSESRWLTLYPGECARDPSGTAHALWLVLREEPHIRMHEAAPPPAKVHLRPNVADLTVQDCPWPISSAVEAWSSVRLEEEEEETTRRSRKKYRALLQATHLAAPPSWAAWTIWAVRLARVSVLGMALGLFGHAPFPAWDHWLVFGSSLLCFAALPLSSSVKSPATWHDVVLPSIGASILFVALMVVVHFGMKDYAMSYWSLPVLFGSMFGMMILNVSRWVADDDATQISFHGSSGFTKGQSCVVSWPGIYAGAWDALVSHARRRRLQAAVVFLPNGTPEYGLHCKCGCEGGDDCTCPIDGGKTCWCEALYGGKKRWGCRWFSHWVHNVNLAVEAGAVLEVYYMADKNNCGCVRPFSAVAADARKRTAMSEMFQEWKRSRGFRHMQSRLARLSSIPRGDRSSQRSREEQRLFLRTLPSEDREYLLSNAGLGNSQKAEVAYLEQRGLDYVSKDVRELPPRVPPRGKVRRQVKWSTAACLTLAATSVPTFFLVECVIETERNALATAELPGVAMEASDEPEKGLGIAYWPIYVPGTLKRANLWACGPCSCAIGMLLECPANLRMLNLSIRGLAHIRPAAFPWNHSLVEVRMGYNMLGFEAAQVLSQRVLEGGVQRLFLPGNFIGDMGAWALASGLAKNRRLETLYISRNSIGARGILPVAKALEENGALSNLVLNNNSLGAAGAVLLAEALRKNRGLRKLKLCSNSMRDEGVVALASALAENGRLRFFAVDMNDFGDEGMRALAAALKVNTGLRTLRLTRNRIGMEGFRALAKAIQSLGGGSKLRQVVVGKKDLPAEAGDLLEHAAIGNVRLE